MDELLVEKGLSHQLSFVFKWPPQYWQEGGGVMELDNEGGIGFRLCYLSMEGGREGLCN
jgi:hypothetical protein